MAKRDITKRPRRALSAEERQELFREFKLGIFALAALVTLVVTLCWDKDGSSERGRRSGEKGTDNNALVRVVWQPGDKGGNPPVQPRPRVDGIRGRRSPQPPRDVAPRRPERPPVEPRRRVTPPVPRGPVYRNYVVRRRDTFWKIAEKQLGDGKLWKVIWKANPGIRNPKRLKRGTIIRIPNSGAGGVSSTRIAGNRVADGGTMILDTSRPVE
jgi:nucleoid-associated protein YgaU